MPALVDGMTDLLERSLGPNITHRRRAFRRPCGRCWPIATSSRWRCSTSRSTRATPCPSGGAITIEAREQELAPAQRLGLPAGRYAVLSVIDHGEGMDEETLQRATEPFFTTKGVGKGTGLGLSMVHGLAEQSGGRLVLKSQPGEGTTAELWLPVIAGRGRRPTAGAGPRRGPAVAAAKPLAILAVDDDALVLMNTAAMLEDQGHRVTMAYSGKEALEILRRGETFDLLITDQGMPGMTGAELVEIVRAEQPDLPIVLATGYAELPPGVAADLPRVSKPFLQNHLLQVVKEAVKG